jgi:chaperonin cofactor prefoldin
MRIQSESNQWRYSAGHLKFMTAKAAVEHALATVDPKDTIEIEADVLYDYRQELDEKYAELQEELAWEQSDGK